MSRSTGIRDSLDGPRSSRRMLVMLVFAAPVMAGLLLWAWLAPLPLPPARPASAQTFVYDTPCSPDWNVVSSPNPSASNNRLFGLAAISSNDIWSVGSYDIGNRTVTLALHWNGTQWSVVPSPSP